MIPQPAVAGSVLESDVLAASSGDTQAFGRLVDASKGVVCSISLAVVRNVGESEDIAQEAFLEAWKSLPRLKNPASFFPWLRQLTRNQARNFLRGQIRRKKRSRPLEDEILERDADPSPSAAERLESRQNAALLRRVLDELPDEAREVITLFYREGQSTRQVSELLGLSEAAVRQRLTRARGKIRQEILDRAGEELRRSSPGSAFTGAVLVAATAALPAASAFGMGASAKVGSSLLAKAGTVVASMLLPAGIAIGANELNVRKIAAGSLDEEEARGFRRFRWVSALTILLCGSTLSLSFLWVEQLWWLPMVPFAVLILSLAFNSFVWVPRLMARRLAEELRRDPAAARRHRRQRWQCIVGFLSGLVFGGLGLAYGILSAVGGG